MQKAGSLKLTFLVLMFCFGFSKALFAQPAADTLGFNWKLLEATDPTIEGKIKFIQTIPNTATSVNWDFGDGNTALGNNPEHVYNITVRDTFSVKLNFLLNTIDSTITHKVCANSAFFIPRLDPNTKVTYVRILRSAFKISVNNKDSLGNMRFEWSVNGNSLGDTVMFDNPIYGHFPNIRYSFKKSGKNVVTFRAWKAADPAKDISFTDTILILPNFSTKVKFPNVPNVFTPNGDNVYDYFEVQTSGLYSLVLKVFTRTGALVYQNQSNFIKWDGKNDNGKDLPEGIYYYIIEDPSGHYENAKGFVYIFRGKK
jgi:gliding motility-associated-like protein